jgi:hypothetical protein
MAKLQSFALSPEQLDLYLEGLDSEQFAYCYLELEHCVVFQAWDPALVSQHELGSCLLAGRLFGQAAELNLRRRTEAEFRCLWTSDDASCPNPGEEVVVELEPHAEDMPTDSTALLWGHPKTLKDGQTVYFDLRVGTHQYPTPEDGRHPESLAIRVRTYRSSEADEPYAQRWVEVAPFPIAQDPTASSEEVTP